MLSTKSAGVSFSAPEIVTMGKMFDTAKTVPSPSLSDGHSTIDSSDLSIAASPT
jgi:hypothetical protein